MPPNIVQVAFTFACEIPAKLELPIFMLRYPAEKIWGPVEMAIGTVLVIRDDRRDLHPHHIEALCHYCRDILHPLFVDSMGFERSLSGIKTKGTLLQTVAKEEFESYFIDYCAEKSKTDGSWAGKVSPYDSIQGFEAFFKLYQGNNDAPTGSVHEACSE